DAIAETEDARIWVAKCLTTPEDPGEAVATVVRDLVRQMAGEHGLRAAAAVGEVVHGTTLVTNTLIERKGAKTALIVTRGTRDVLNIGREVRYDLYDLGLLQVKPLVPVERRYEVDERIDVHGGQIAPLDRDATRRFGREVSRSGVEAVAVCFLH